MKLQEWDCYKCWSLSLSIPSNIVVSIHYYILDILIVYVNIQFLFPRAKFSAGCWNDTRLKSSRKGSIKCVFHWARTRQYKQGPCQWTREAVDKGRMVFPKHRSLLAGYIYKYGFQLLWVCCGLGEKNQISHKRINRKFPTPTLHSQWKSTERVALNPLKAESGLRAMTLWTGHYPVQDWNNHGIPSLETNGPLSMCSG